MNSRKALPIPVPLSEKACSPKVWERLAMMPTQTKSMNRSRRFSCLKRLSVDRSSPLDSWIDEASDLDGRSNGDGAPSSGL